MLKIDVYHKMHPHGLAVYNQSTKYLILIYLLIPRQAMVCETVSLVMFSCKKFIEKKHNRFVTGSASCL